MIKAAEKRSAKDRILDTAVRLFYQHSYHSVGIDRIIAESGVAKMSLYNHFPSKDVLIVAAIKHMDAQFWEWIDRETVSAKSAREKLKRIFVAVQQLAISPACLGCAFQAAVADFPDLEHLNHKAAQNHKTKMLDYLARLAKEAGIRNPKGLARQLVLLMDGAWASARMYSTNGPASELAGAAEALIAASTPLKKVVRPKRKQRKG
ncbi:TetR/AcrR family transcriptional regulator [bacterium]|nr:TetR/AcrR family transcriptional regulator [bacterium]